MPQGVSLTLEIANREHVLRLHYPDGIASVNAMRSCACNGALRHCATSPSPRNRVFPPGRGRTMASFDAWLSQPGTIEGLVWQEEGRRSCRLPSLRAFSAQEGDPYGSSTMLVPESDYHKAAVRHVARWRVISPELRAPSRWPRFKAAFQPLATAASAVLSRICPTRLLAATISRPTKFARCVGASCRERPQPDPSNFGRH